MGHGLTKSAATSSDLAVLCRDHLDEVFRPVYRRCRDRELAEDVTQDAFLAAAKTSNVDANTRWLLGGARNRLIDILRRQDALQERLPKIGSTEDATDWSDLAIDRIWLEDALGRLKVEHRLVLSLHYLDGYTVKQLAEALDRTPKSVESLMTRARLKLRAEVSHHE